MVLLQLWVQIKPLPVTRTESFNFNFLDYIPSAVPIIPAETNDPPVTVEVGDDSYVPEYDYIQAGYTCVCKWYNTYWLLNLCVWNKHNTCS